jgi:hypothetical protein
MHTGLTCIDVYAYHEAGVGCKGGGGKKAQNREQLKAKTHIADDD